MYVIALMMGFKALIHLVYAFSFRQIGALRAASAPLQLLLVKAESSHDGKLGRGHAYLCAFPTVFPAKPCYFKDSNDITGTCYTMLNARQPSYFSLPALTK